MDKLDLLMKKIGYVFNSNDRLIKALTHRSYINENNHTMHKQDNEKLEFLGDSVLNLITTEYIMKRYKNLSEGELSKIKSQIISESVFSTIAKDLGLGDNLYLSKGEHYSGGRDRKSILGDAFEALIGAIFEDSDYYTTKKVALKLLIPKIENLDKIEGVGDYKTDLQELVQSRFKQMPVYKLVETTGPDHNKVFRVNVSIDNKVYAEGIAKSKKTAEKEAARKALEKLEDL